VGSVLPRDRKDLPRRPGGAITRAALAVRPSPQHPQRRVTAKVEWHPGELYPRVGFIVTNMSHPAVNVVAISAARRSSGSRRQGGDQVDAAVLLDVRGQCRPPSASCAYYNLGNFLRTLAMPEPIRDWSVTTLKVKLTKIGAKLVRHGSYVAFQMAEVGIPRTTFAEVPRLIAELRPQPPTAPA
jgi:hypothetical protein